MTIEQSKNWGLGQSYWLQYVRLNGYAVEANKDGLLKLSKNLDLNIRHLKRMYKFIFRKLIIVGGGEWFRVSRIKIIEIYAH